MKNIKQTIAHVLAQFVILGIWTISAIAANDGDWDEPFHTSFMNNIGNDLGANRISCVTTLGTEVYLGSVNAFGPPCYVWRYKETDGTWTQLASFDGPVYALSLALQNGYKYLFVGGQFSSVTYGTHTSNASNVIALNLSTGVISPMGAGTDGPVYALKALPWWDSYPAPPYYFAGIRCLVGGKFTTVDWTSQKSIACWKQGTVISSGWFGFNGGFQDDGYGNLPKVYGIEAKTTTGMPTAFDSIWVTGAISRGTMGFGTNVHIAKLSGTSGDTANWVYLGRGFQRLGTQTDGSCGVDTYGSYYGLTICQSSTSVYFGGFGTGHLRSDGTVLACHACGEECTLNCDTGLISTPGTSGTSLAADCRVSLVAALAPFGSDLYASGSLWDENFQHVNYGKLSGGVWSSIPVPTDGSGYALAAASSGNYVYFVGKYCWRWDPNLP